MTPRHSPIDLIDTGPVDGKRILVLAHGAGAPMDSSFMNDIADRLAARGVRCLRFEFPYMAERRRDGRKRPPDRQELLLAHFEAVIRQIRDNVPPDADLYIGGKSMGGRMATLLAARAGANALIKGVLCLGYPFHPPGKPEKTRTAHLSDIECPVLICQGDRDPFGTRAEVEAYALPASLQLHWLPDGNHDLAPRVKSGITVDDNLNSAVAAISIFLE